LACSIHDLGLGCCLLHGLSRLRGLLLLSKLSPLEAGGRPSCPKGQTLQTASVAYTNILLTDLTNGISISVPDISSGCLLPNVRGAC
jgi:hypothetical protein